MTDNDDISITVKELIHHGDKCQIINGNGWTLILWDENIMFPGKPEEEKTT